MESNILCGSGHVEWQVGANYVSEIFGKDKFSDERTNSFSLGIFFRLLLISYLGVCKTSVRFIGWAKSLSPTKVHHGATVVREHHEIC